MINNSSKKIKLDLKSRKLLNELEINARQSYSKIGKKVGLSKDMTAYRIKQMESSGLIKGYYTLGDSSKLGYMTFRIFMKFYNVTPKKEDEILQYLNRDSRVGWLVSIRGNWDANMLVWAKSATEFKKFWDAFLDKYQNFLEDKWISIVTQMIQYQKTGFLNLENYDSHEEIVGGELERNVDSTDIKMLKILSSDARISLLALGKKLGISPKVADYRIKKMLRDKVILSFRPLLDLSMLNVLYFKSLFTLHNMTKEKEKMLLSYARFHPNIIITAITVGGADFEIEIYVTGNEQLDNLIADMREKFHDIIRSIDTMGYYKEYKWNYFPLD